jgi:NIPSNAP
MITCYLRYVIDPAKLKEFETYSRVWIGLVNRFEGIHHGYLLPSEGASNVAVAAFSFPSLAAYEIYRLESADDPDCQAAFKYAETTQCIVSYASAVFSAPSPMPCRRRRWKVNPLKVQNDRAPVPR